MIRISRDIITLQGHLVLIDDFNERIMPLKAKSVTVSWEIMFTRSFFRAADMEAQHRLLREVSELIDAGVPKTTLTEELGPIKGVAQLMNTWEYQKAALRSSITLGAFVANSSESR